MSPQHLALLANPQPFVSDPANPYLSLHPPCPLCSVICQNCLSSPETPTQPRKAKMLQLHCKVATYLSSDTLPTMRTMNFQIEQICSALLEGEKGVGFTERRALYHKGEHPEPGPGNLKQSLPEPQPTFHLLSTSINCPRSSKNFNKH